MTSKGQRRYAAQGIALGCRADGRAGKDYRPLQLELAVVPQANGSARCLIGASEVLVAVKVEVNVPEEDFPDQGVVHFSVECSPCASAAFQGRGALDLGADMAGNLRRSVLGGSASMGGSLDLKALCIISGSRCWHVHVDGLVINADGSLLDALSIATRAALTDLQIPRVDISPSDDPEDEPEIELDDDPEHAASLDASRIPVVVTLAEAEGRPAVDLTADEEASCPGPRVHVAVNGRGCICGLHKQGNAPLQLEALQEMLALAQQLGPRLCKAVNAQCTAQLHGRRQHA
ncbi:hypothetical protein WJX73_009206 [Symbiochloris irregularis]|uniref:Ribosomal RNA-processing protein 42 n=1 Tax=Symbiochloris irregularis TaxID=706552 RepID=A0AAW1PBR7_9CHLO